MVPIWRKGTAEIEQFHSYKQRSFSLFWVKTSDKLRLAIFTLPTTTEQSTVIQEAPCALSGSVFVYCEWAYSGSPSGSRVGVSKSPPHPTPHMTEVKMDGMTTVMNARSDRWMNGVTWWLDNRNYPQDWRSKCWRGPHNWVWCRTFKRHKGHVCLRATAS